MIWVLWNKFFAEGKSISEQLEMYPYQTQPDWTGSHPGQAVRVWSSLQLCHSIFSFLWGSLGMWELLCFLTWPLCCCICYFECRICFMEPEVMEFTTMWGFSPGIGQISLIHIYKSWFCCNECKIFLLGWDLGCISLELKRNTLLPYHQME